MNRLDFAKEFWDIRAIPITAARATRIGGIDSLNESSINAVPRTQLVRYTGSGLGTSMIWAAGLNAGPNTVIYSGLLRRVTAALKNLARPLGELPIGRLIEYLYNWSSVQVPRCLARYMDGASATYAGQTLPVESSSDPQSTGKNCDKH